MYSAKVRSARVNISSNSSNDSSSSREREKKQRKTAEINERHYTLHSPRVIQPLHVYRKCVGLYIYFAFALRFPDWVKRREKDREKKKYISLTKRLLD